MKRTSLAYDAITLIVLASFLCGLRDTLDQSSGTKTFCCGIMVVKGFLVADEIECVQKVVPCAELKRLQLFLTAKAITQRFRVCFSNRRKMKKIHTNYTIKTEVLSIASVKPKSKGIQCYKTAKSHHILQEIIYLEWVTMFIFSIFYE